MKSIAIFQCDLRVGGIQKALINILNEIDYSQCEVDLYLFDDKCFFDLPKHKNLNIIFLKPYFWLNRLVYFNILRRCTHIDLPDKAYDVAIDFNSYRNECAIGAIQTNAKKRVMWIHNDVEIKLRNEIKYRVLWHFFKSKLRYFDEFCAVSPGIIDGFRRVSGITDREITPIPNHVDTGEIFRKAEKPLPGFEVDPTRYNLCSVGRLCHQKGYDMLMAMLAEVKTRRDDLHFYLIGDGPEREKLEHQIKALGLCDMVTLLGNQANPFNYLERMDGFVLTSRYEGQGIVILEAKALGLQIFISPNLEKYNPGIPGTEDIPAALSSAQRREKIRDDLASYNTVIGESLSRVLELKD
ncbi:MAG: glycosyltransferase [Oscillospiraceae bacterium]